MEWTEEHDVILQILLHEILEGDFFSFKKGSVAWGERWESIADKLNERNDEKAQVYREWRWMQGETESQRRNVRFKPLVEFMQEKAKSERELRQQELDIRRLEQEQNQQVMVTVLQKQKQQ